ncbi:MAG TPA: class I SAM-dependent methyltransferase [Nocardioides sp.]|uniref:class I SAM-dependent methyltransferase n=1 Tax=Nocardioides sp. TaxID=35761 RepID=UPI002F3F29BB
MDTAEYWDRQAAHFDESPDHGLNDPVVRTAWSKVLLPLLPTECNVADLGCGTGSLSVLLAEHGHCVTGVDVSSRMVEAAVAKASAAGVDATFIVGDAAEPPLAPGAYDVVLSRHVLWAMPDPDEALGRWVRLLRPGGRVVLVEGRWWTGAGLSAAEVTELLLRHRSEARLQHLEDAELWGGPIGDERFLVHSTA